MASSLRPLSVGATAAFGLVAFGAIGACATALSSPFDDATDGGSDVTNAACPQYDVTTDPKHCGSCSHVCTSDQICSAGECRAQCSLPTVKCGSGSGGSATCIDVKSDPQHCGACTHVCPVVDDAGSLLPGPGTPEGGLPFDGGAGWSLGMPSCEAGACGTACASGMTACSDGICYDTQNFHDHCGDCNTACMPDTEWCNYGHCCTLDQMYCGGSCIDALSDDANCGACGKSCGGSTPHCYGGVCSATCAPTGARRPFNTLSSHTSSGCWSGNPCGQGTYAWSSSNGQSFVNVNENIVCGGTTACVSHVGITTYSSSANCQGAWDVYCDSTKVGSIDTTVKACSGDAMTNGCSTTFMPTTCTSIKLVVTGTSGGSCCNTTGIHSMVTGVSAW